MARAQFGVAGVRIAGRVERMVFVPQANGTLLVRELPDRLPPRTAKQKETADRFKPVAAAWHALSPEEAAAWRAYAQGVGRRADGRVSGAYNLFTALGTKCLQMRPDAPVPTLPPTTRFLGDGIQVSIADLGSGIAERSTETANLENGSEIEDPRSAIIVFSADGPNSQGVVTELLLQPLKGRNRLPSAKEYRTQRFVAFTADARETTVAVGPGFWACAVRFVREATGQESEVVPLGTVVVEAAGA